jgi:aryl-alcohol dehydrogenase-like predicted oxidoreductase
VVLSWRTGGLEPADAAAHTGWVTELVELAGLAGLGTAQLGSGPGWAIDWGRNDPAEAKAVLRTAVDAGVRWIDTAPFYGSGRAETLVGDALRGLDHRPALLTKCGTVPRSGGPGGSRGAASIRADLDASLGRLGCASVDVLQLHYPDPAIPVEAAWEEICALVSEGKVSAGGLSNHPLALMDRAAAVGPVSVVQHQYSLLHRTPELEGVLDWCAERGAVFLAWSPLASGFLADGFDLTALEPGDFRRRKPFADPGLLKLGQLRRDLGALADQAGLSMTALAIGWVLAKGARAIIGARTPAEAAEIVSYQPLTADLAVAAEQLVSQAWVRA